MNFVWSIILGVIQGLTEFLPVSSSGHLVLVQNFIPSFTQPGVLFDVVLHAGTLFSILFYFRKMIFELSSRYIMLLIVGTVPAALAGFLFQSFFENLFTLPKIVGTALLVTGLFNFLTDKNEAVKRNLTIKDAVFIGIFQAIAIIPGISRSGSTIFAGSYRGVEKLEAAQFSFLLSVPAVAGATLLQVLTHGGDSSANIEFYLAGFLAAFISGYFAIKIVYKFLSEKKFRLFGVYCSILGLLTLLL